MKIYEQLRLHFFLLVCVLFSSNFVVVSPVLPVLGQPALLFPIGVGAPGPAASRKQD